MEISWTDVESGGYILVRQLTVIPKVKIVKNEIDPTLFTGKLLIKFQNILRNATQVNIRHREKILFSAISSPVKRVGFLSFLGGTISNVLVMEIGWTDVGSGWYILVSCAHSNTSCIEDQNLTHTI
jgi:hypothetical protein